MKSNQFITEIENISDSLVYLAQTASPGFDSIDRKIISTLIYGALLSYAEREHTDENTISKFFEKILCKSMNFTPEETEKIHSDIVYALCHKQEPTVQIIEQGKEMLADYDEIIEGLKHCILDRFLYSRRLIVNH